MSQIHPSAIIEPGAEIAENVRIGPFCHIGPRVRVGEDVVLHAHVVIQGNTEIGEATEVYPFASLGTSPQDLKYQGEDSRLVIGARNRIREHVTMNTGTEGGGMLTRVGNDGLFMVGAHVAHDCVIGDHVILVNNATLGGHVIVEDHAILGGLSAVHQHVRIGAHAMIGGMSGIENDVIPFATAMGNRASLSGLNLIGLKRRKFSRDEINALRDAYKQLFGAHGTFQERVEQVSRDFADSQAVKEIVQFIQKGSNRAFCQPTPGDAR